MNEYALLIDGVFSEIRRYEAKPEDIPHKAVAWYDVVRETGDAFNGLENGVWVIRTPVPPPTIPYSVAPRQVRLLLLQRSMLADVEAMIAQQDEATRITWEYALEFRRDDPLLNQLAENLGLAQEDIDQFFIDANLL